MDDFSFDDRDALVTADIDLIMDDESCDAMASDAVIMWQDDAARILFADVDPAAIDEVFAPVKQRTSDWRQPGPRTDSQPRSARGHRKHRSFSSDSSSSSSGAMFCQAAPSTVKFEPSHEPCTEEVPYSDLVFWLGDSATGEVKCSCGTCMYARAYTHLGTRSRRYSPYERLSSKIPVINIPRIEGVN